MKGIVLAGGLGSRLYPLTHATNKHLLPIYDEPMVYYPVRSLVDAGIDEVMIVTGGPHAGDFIRVIQNGEELGLKHIEYAYQKAESGIADALDLAEDFADGGKIAVILGDNIFENNTQIKKAVADFAKQPEGAKIMLKEVPDPERFGVAEVDGKKVTGIEEKPKKPKSNQAVVGFYLYDARVFEIIKTLDPSERGELEITDVNNNYIKAGTMTWESVEGWWTDAGTFDTLVRANMLMIKKAQGSLPKV